MFKYVGIAAACLLVAGLLPSIAHADDFTVDNITVNYTNNATNLGDVPRVGKNDVLGLTSSTHINGYFGTELTISGIGEGQHAVITVTYIGKEAGYTNAFYGDGNQLFITDGGSASAYGDSASWNQDADGTIDFEFRTDENFQSHTPNPAASSVSNGSNPNDVNGTAGAMNFVVVDGNVQFPVGGWDIQNGGDLGTGDNTIDSVLADNTILTQSLFLFMDDNGAGPDDNHDDMVIMISARIVDDLQPVPEPGSLLLMGLGLTSLGAAVSRRRRKDGDE